MKEFKEAHRFPAIQDPEPKVSRRRPSRKEKDQESDEHRLQQRAKQIAYGENTPGYANLLRILDTNPSLLKGCLPVKPSVTQKCSKRSWDGQIRKWRRALHMYDFVDFGDSAEQTEAIREALVDQNKNPLFTPTSKRTLPDGQEVTLTPKPHPNPVVQLPDDFDPSAATRVQYSFNHLFQLADSNLVAPFVDLPDHLSWLDKRVDLEDDLEEEHDWPSLMPAEWLSPSTPGPEPLSPPLLAKAYAASGSPSMALVPGTPGYTSPTVSVGHCDDSPLDPLASLRDNGLDCMDQEPPWFPLEDYMPPAPLRLEDETPEDPYDSVKDFSMFRPSESSLFSANSETWEDHTAPRPLPEAISYFTAPDGSD